MPTKISLNGADNTGKTTQIRLLKEQFGKSAVIVPSLPELNSDWQNVPGDFAWYFGDSQHEAWLKLMLDSLFIRDQFIKSIPGEIILIDRGVKMSLIYIAAALKERLKLSSMTSAGNLLAKFIARNYGELPDQEDFLILLKQSESHEENILTTIKRCQFDDAEMISIYTRYQADLNAGLESITGLPNCQTIVIGPKSIEEVNTEIRKKICAYAPIC
ncbi:hypothetical protein IT411_01215 [Candidatus Peregrinibacteria bacterium]|nr:hypothetical protein [Candidatus Peregrinibacteria bacterium]